MDPIIVNTFCQWSRIKVYNMFTRVERFINQHFHYPAVYIKQYQAEFSRMDVQDCIKMALLSYAVDFYKVQARSVDEASWNTLLGIQKQLELFDAWLI